ncbi:MAG: hypothetical protein A4E64_02153 [Syntrophorhabdus sp. PtaU1.Bin058]|nr:MAG: hypothetical protein A4E64_02153 [Syntrophorhabdus sp. PtaU1.Bin058]
MKLPDLILVLAGLSGAIFNAYGSPIGFAIWIPANIGLVIINWTRGYAEQALLFVAYTVISVIGVVNWMVH